MEHRNGITAFVKCAKSNKTDKEKNCVTNNLKWSFKYIPTHILDSWQAKNTLQTTYMKLFIIANSPQWLMFDVLQLQLASGLSE